MNSFYPLLLLSLFLPLSAYGGYIEHQGYLYGGVGAGRAWVDAYNNGYTYAPAVFGLGYRLNWHGGGRHVLEFGLSLGGGYGASYKKGGLPAGNSLVEMDISLGYGLAFGKYKEHQLTVIGGTMSPRFHGMAEKNRYRAIGGTEIRYYEGSYAMLLAGVVLPGYRYVHRNFMVGVRHQFLALTAGHFNVNYPKEYRVLAGYGYEFKLELGFSFAPGGLKREERGVLPPMEGLVLQYRAGARDILSLSLAVDGALVDLDIYLGKRPIAFARDIPVFAGRAQFTKHVKRGFLKEGDRVIVYYTVKDGEGGILSSHSNETEVCP